MVKKEAMFSKLREFGLTTKKAYLDEAFSRNTGLLTQEEQQQLADARVAIPGMGGVGGVHLITLVRTGIGKFHLSDFDSYEPANINRQFGARVPDFGRPKLETMVEQALSINPYLEIKQFPEGISEANVDDFLDGVQVVLDGLDFFCFDVRRLLFKRARERGVYVITAGPMGFSSAMLIFSPDEGMGFDEYFNIMEGMSDQDRYLAFGLGLAPRATHVKYMDLSKVDLESKAGPSLNIACQMCSGMAATEALRIILRKGKIKPVPHFFQFDPYVQKYRKGKLYMGNRNPIQKTKMRVVKMLLGRKKRQYRASPPELPKVEILPDHVPEEAVEYIIRAGIQAPSGDNCQPWRFARQNNEIHLYLNRVADECFFNVRQLASIISCGAVLENMRVAATAIGMQTNMRLLPTAGQDDLMASIELIQDDMGPDPLANYVWTRHTNRKFYEKKPVPSSVLHDLQESITGFPGVKLHVVSEESELKKIARIIYRVDRIRTEHRPIHEHLCSMIRYSQEEAVEKRDGLPLKNLEAGFAGEMFLKMTRPWWVMNLVNRIGLGRMVALHSYQGTQNASAVALLTVDGMEIEDFLKGGQALERIWLSLTRKGLMMQPMTAITLFSLRWQMEGAESFSQKHQKLLSHVWEIYQDLFPELDFLNQGQIMLFRFGYGQGIRYGTYRKNYRTFLLRDRR